MGQEIGTTGFVEADFEDFAAQLARETALLRELHDAGKLSGASARVGLELEAWLIDRNCFPAPHNQDFLHRLDDPFVVAELSRFNIELNCFPEFLVGEGLLAMERHLSATWQRCIANAHEDVDTVIAIGTLPTLRESDLSLENMTPSNRYAALNAEMIRLREGRPLKIDIESSDPAGAHLRTEHLDVMLEAATTSFQLHLQVPPSEFGACLNASIVLSAPMVAVAANAPFLFGRALWHETRIPIFEQSVEQAGDDAALHRVTFGTGYAGADPIAFFEENLAQYPAILPIGAGEDEAKFPCLRLHNGTIWRWNRPLAGFDDDGTPHLRIEHRVMPAGPSVIDMIANAALYYGATFALAERCRVPTLPFEAARENFYAAAKHGLGAEIAWLDGRRRPVQEVIAEIIPLARLGLTARGVTSEVADRYLDVVASRNASGQNGAAWQLAHFAEHGDLFRLTADYLEHQRSGMPVHEWPI